MADEIRCPMCNKLNPADLTNCRFCGARLTPLIGSPEPPVSEPPAQPPEDEADDWLRRLRGDSPKEVKPAIPTANPPPQPAAPIPEEELPDWLARIRERSRAEQMLEQHGEDSELSEDLQLPDWQSVVKPKAETPPGKGGDWLSEFRASGISRGEEPAAQTTSEPLAPPTSEKPLENEPQEPSRAEPAETPSEFKGPEKITDWLRALQAAETAKAEAAAAAAQTPSSAAPPPSPVPAESTTDESPGWMSGTVSEPPAPVPASQTPAEELPDWLREFDATPSPSITGTIQAPIESLENGLPGEPAAKTTSIEMPDWLASYHETGESPTIAKTEAATENQPAAAPVSPFTGTPDTWQTPSKDESKAIQDKRPAETPDWLKNIVPQTSTSKPGETAPSSAPAWLTDLEQEAASSATFLQPQPPEDMASSKVTAYPVDTSASLQPFVGDELPEWLSETPPHETTGLETQPFSSTAGIEEKTTMGGVSPFGDEAMPEWLGEGPAEEAQAAQQAETNGESIEPAQLPNWLQALRPIKAVVLDKMPQDDVQKIEKSGPLVGLRGLLSGEDLVTQYQKPPTYSVKLRVTEKQRLHASLLENILAEETHVKEARGKRTQAPQRLLRLLVGVLFILVILIMLFTGSSTAANPPKLYPIETSSLFDIVNKLPAGKPVLMAVDYEAGLSGEMIASSESMIAELISKQTPLVTISTIPAGPILANQLINAALQASGQPASYFKDKTVNLGYLAGGMTSLQEFAKRPQQAAPYALDSTNTGLSPWGGPILQGVNTIQDFASVIVITDNAEVGRAWIEQIQPKLGNVPMLMVVSAQSAPIIQPYFGSRQVQGLISGLPGSMAYEQIRQVPGIANSYWGAFQAGLSMAVAFIALGIIFQGIAALFAPRKAKREA